MAQAQRPRAQIDASKHDAALFDMDGVITRTATLHAQAWKRTFDAFLAAGAGNADFEPFDAAEDYRRYVDGKPRYDGVASFIAARGISLPYGAADDPPGYGSVYALGNSKDLYFEQLLRDRGVEVFDSTIELVRRLRALGLKTGVFSASKHARKMLSAAGVLDLFDATVDGVDAEELGLPGKPDPATLVELARRLGTEPERCVVAEDAIAGVEAGRAGAFGLVIGVNRHGAQGALTQAGADIEVRDLGEMEVRGSAAARRAAEVRP